MRIIDIARIANVHVSTVSRSLNNSPLVSEETSARIKKIAEENGFEFNASARGLITSRVGTIAVILPHNFDQFPVTVFHSELHNYLRMILEREDYDLIVTFHKNRFTGVNNIIRLFKRKKIDGIILIHQVHDDETERFMKESNIPFIYAHYPPENININDDVVYVDHFHGGYIAAEAFVSRGILKLLCLKPDTGDTEYKLRLKGFEAYLKERNIPFGEKDIWTIPPTFEAGFNEIKRKKDEIDNYQGLFALTDFTAYGALQACRESGISVPNDLAVIGYDDIKFSQYISPALTTIHQPIDQIAKITCERLIELIRNKERGKKWETKRILIKPEIVFRKSLLL